MFASSSKGNDPARWNKLLSALDEKLQLGLLDYLARANAYHFEAEVLYIEPGSDADEKFLMRDSTFHQLEIFALDATGVEKVKIKKLTTG